MFRHARGSLERLASEAQSGLRDRSDWRSIFPPIVSSSPFGTHSAVPQYHHNPYAFGSPIPSVAGNMFPTPNHPSGPIFGSAPMRNETANDTGPTAPTAAAVSGDSKKRVSFVDGLSDGKDYVGALKAEKPEEFETRFRKLFGEATETFRKWRKETGRPPPDEKTIMSESRRKAQSRLSKELESENTSQPLIEPRANAFQDTMTVEKERQWAIDELKEEAEERYWIVRDQLQSMEANITEANVQQIVLGWLNETHGEEISNLKMDDWTAQAKAPKHRAWVKISEEDHASLTASLDWPGLRKACESQGIQASDEQLREYCMKNIPRYRKLDLSPEEMSKYPQGVQHSLKATMSTSNYPTDVSQLSAWQKKHLTALSHISKSGEDKETIDRKMREYSEKHRKMPAYTIDKSDDANYTVSFNGVDLDSGVAVKATLPDGKTVSVQRWLPAPDSNPSNQTTTVDTSGPNPFVAREGTSEAWQRHKSNWSRSQKRYEKEKREKEKKGKEKKGARPPTLKSYFGSSTGSNGSDGKGAGKGLDDWARGDDSRRSEKDYLKATMNLLALESMSQKLQTTYKMPLDRATKLSMWTLDRQGSGWELDPKDGKLKIQSTGDGSMLPEIKDFLEEHQMSGDVKPEEVLTTALTGLTTDSDSKSWQGQAFDDWACKPTWRPGTAEPLSFTQAYQRVALALAAKDLLQKASKAALNHEPTLQQLSALSTYAADASSNGHSLQSSFQYILPKWKENPQWIPGPSDWPMPKTAAGQKLGTTDSSAASTNPPSPTSSAPASATASAAASSTPRTTSSTTAGHPDSAGASQPANISAS